MPTMPQPVRLRSAIVIVETETGETMQMVLTPEWWQPVEMQMDVDYSWEASAVAAPPALPTWTVTLVAGGYAGQYRSPQHDARQSGPAAIG